jgi:hypothetical protein
MPEHQQPSLFGLEHSNRDFTIKSSWGKNNFNSSFPASLCCYLDSIGKSAVYLSMIDEVLGHAEIPITEVFGISPSDDDAYFAFESTHTPFQRFVIGALPRTDLVIQKRSDGQCLAAIEIKLTALPDNTTHLLADSGYGCELVVRPDTIVYLACSLAKSLGDYLDELIPDDLGITDWSDAHEVLPHIQRITSVIYDVSLFLDDSQTPFLLQPIWKTKGKSPELAENCLDIFIWSDAGFAYFISEIADNNHLANRVNRQTRTAIWLFKMLLDIKEHGRFDHHQIIDNLSYNTKNDKAFASAGNVTNRFMASARLETPIITKREIKNVILGGGQNLLSPERRFDAIIFNSPELFKI